MAIDLSAIWRKINAKKASGGFIPQGFTEDVVKANLAAETQRADRDRSLTMDQQRIDESKRQFEISKAENTRQFDSAQAERDRLAAEAAAARLNEFNTNTALTKEQQAQRVNEFNTQSNLTADQIAAQKTQGITSAIVQAPLAAMSGKYLYDKLMGPKDPGIIPKLTPGGNPALPPAEVNPLVPDAYSPVSPSADQWDAAMNASDQMDVMPIAEGAGAGAGSSTADVTANAIKWAGAEAAPAVTSGVTGLTDSAAAWAGEGSTVGAEGAGATGAGSMAVPGWVSPVAAGYAALKLVGEADKTKEVPKELQQGAKFVTDVVEKPFEEIGSGVTSAAGTVICTELHRQGLLDGAVWETDKQFRGMVSQETYEGYRILADPVVKLMQESPLFTVIFAPFALRTAREMAHRVDRDITGSWLGSLVLGVFEPICLWLGHRRGNVLNPVIP